MVTVRLIQALGESVSLKTMQELPKISRDSYTEEKVVIEMQNLISKSESLRSVDLSYPSISIDHLAQLLSAIRQSASIKSIQTIP